MKKIIRTLCVLIAVLAFASCQEDEMEKTVKEGLPCSLTLSISVPEAGEAVMTKATDVQETSVEKVALLFYKKSQPDEVPVVVEITNLGTPTEVNKSATSYKYTVTVSTDELYSGEWYLYAVANYDKLFVHVSLDQLKTMTKAEIDKFCTGGSDELDIIETAVLMSGKYEQEEKDGTITLKEGNNDLKGDPCLVLRRMISKSIFIFENGTGVTFTPVSYDIYNYSNSSTLMERTGWVDKEGNKNVKGTFPGSLDYEAASGTSLRKKMNIPIENGQFFFYTQENVQKTTTDVSSYDKRETRDDENGNHDKFKYAPAGATYVVVKGRYDGPGKDDGTTVTGDVEYTIHLGDFSSVSGSNNNFTVRRNVKYTYKVTVTGVNSIIVEAQSDAYDGDDFQHGAEGSILSKNDALNVNLDSHYEQVLFAIPVGGNLSEYALAIKTPYTIKTITKDSDWDSDDDIKWVMFGKPASSTTFQSYSEVMSSGLCNIKELLGYLKDINNAESLKYFLVSNDKSIVYVAAYVDEYYYENKALETFVGADPREMILSSGTSVSKDGHSSYTVTPLFALQQRSIKSPMNLDVSNPFGLETVEEGEELKMRDGSDEGDGDVKTGSSEDNGWDNMTSTELLVGKKWSEVIDESKNGYIEGKLGGGSNILKTGYNYSIYQMITRNRDTNCDGKIDKDEIRWFLPSHNQCLVIWYGDNSMPTEVKLKTGHLYLTSTANVGRTWWSDEGVCFGYWKPTDKPGNEASQAGKNLVRTIRALKSYNEETTSISTYDADTKTITVSGISNDCLRLYDIEGNYAAHNVGAIQDRLPNSFKIASEKISTTFGNAATGNNIGAEYSEESDDSDKGMWRVPNEKELGLMFKWLGSKLKTSATARTTYGARYYWISNNAGAYFLTTDETAKAGNTAYVWLVRDVEPIQKSYDSSYTNSGVGFGVK